MQLIRQVSRARPKPRRRPKKTPHPAPVIDRVKPLRRRFWENLKGLQAHEDARQTGKFAQGLDTAPRLRARYRGRESEIDAPGPPNLSHGMSAVAASNQLHEVSGRRWLLRVPHGSPWISGIGGAVEVTLEGSRIPCPQNELTASASLSFSRAGARNRSKVPRYSPGISNDQGAGWRSP
jgi:hypothetical protein